ncbi:MAG TPA: helix-turn-helix domain-containing protein, partial [Desulfuromonadaceae bacterium]
LGAAAPRRVNVRVLSATSRDLGADVRAGRFREDLFFRLNVFSIQLPPLRERIDDLPLLAGHFLVKYCQAMQRPPVRITPDAMRLLMAYGWPGNIRELENVMERGLILCEGDVISSQCLPDGIRGAEEAQTPLPDEDLSIKKAEDAIERDLIRKALARTGGNRTQAAKILEISHRSLLYKLKEFGIE